MEDKIEMSAGSQSTEYSVSLLNQVSLEAVSKANVSMSQVAQTHPVINLIEDLSTHSTLR